jgi:uncharacterized protein (DUF58 family)
MSSSPLQAEKLLGRLEWTVIRKLDGLMQGNYRTLYRGFGLDFADLREYQPHDDVRHIDWNVTARTLTPHVRVYNEDREVTAWFLLDLSPSVDFGSGEATKRQVLTEFVAVMARLLTRQGNKVGAVLFNGMSDFRVPARTGRAHVLHLIDKVLAHPRLLRAPETDIGAFLLRALAGIGRRSVVFVVSDFISRPGWQRLLFNLSQRHESLAVRLVDPLEMALPDIGMMTFQDAETGEQMVVDTADPGFRRRFAALAGHSEAAMMEAFNAAGVDVLELSTGDDLVDAVMRFAGMRRAETRGASGAMPGSFGSGATTEGVAT